ncbi:MAG: UDP-glucose 4-epimerase [Myxococcaceae bacterium]|nr:UDP-glucose 4-epimerase [Myxococcaceae bacterium]
METVLVTGAAGTVGNYVARLCEAAGYAVVASDTNARGIRQPTRGRIEAGDLTERDVRERAMDGVDHVIHTAALLDASTHATRLGRVNTDLVIELFELAAQRRVKRFVHMSTCMLYAPGAGIPLTEDAPTAPRGPHGLSKLGAEAFLRGRGRGESPGPAWTILRAAPIYGRRGRHFAASLLAVGPLLRLFTPLIPRLRGGPRHSFVHAEDVARALLFTLADSRTHYGIYNVADEDPLALGDRLSQTYEAYGLRQVNLGEIPELVRVLSEKTARTPGVLRAFDASVLALWRAVVVRHGLKPALRPRIDREAVTLLKDELLIDTSRLRALGFRTRHPHFSTGWADVLRWYQAESWVPRY